MQNTAQIKLYEQETLLLLTTKSWSFLLGNNTLQCQFHGGGELKPEHKKRGP